MDRAEKKRMRDRIGEHLDVSKTRMTDDEVAVLSDFIDGYGENHKGRSETRRSSFTDWSSDGRYTREEEVTDTFTDDIGIRQDYSYQDDDGQRGESSTEIKDARGILNWLRDHR